MKNRILFILAIAVLFFTPVTTQAGLLVRKQTVAAATAASTNSAAMAQYTKEEQAAITEAVTAIQESKSPSGTFVRMLYRGQVSTIALLCGIAGFFFPIFSVVAVAFGFLGFSNRGFRKKGLGVAAFILGIAVIVMLAFEGTAPLPIF